MPLQQLWNDAHQSICSLTFYRGAERISSGSGFKVGSWLVTNNHVLQVPGAQEVRLRFVASDGHHTSAEQVMTPAALQAMLRDGEPEEHWDFAVLDLTGTQFEHLPSLGLSGVDVWAVGKEVAHLGFHFEQDNLAIHGGVISSAFTRNGVEYLQLDASVNQGNSGGPLMDPESGQVVGIVTRKATGLTQQFDSLIQSFDQNITVLQAVQGGMRLGGVDPMEVLVITQRQLAQVALAIKRSANVGIGYAYTIGRIRRSLELLDRAA